MPQPPHCLPLCGPAKRGQVCIDDLCRSNPDNTLCGFDKSLWEEITQDYFEDGEPYCDEDDGEQKGLFR